LPQKADLELLSYANSYNFAVLPILTKMDKCNKKELALCMRAWETYFERETLLSTSAKDKTGIEKVWEAVLRMLAAIR
jgi:GTP-binding protein